MIAPASTDSDIAPIQRQQDMPWASKTARAFGWDSSASRMDISFVNPVMSLVAASFSGRTVGRPFALPGRLEHNSAPLPNQAEGYSMSKVCVSCGKAPAIGNNRSHSNRATKRRFDPNLQRVRIQVDGRPQNAYVCTRCLKSGRVQKAL